MLLIDPDCRFRSSMLLIQIASSIQVFRCCCFAAAISVYWLNTSVPPLPMLLLLLINSCCCCRINPELLLLLSIRWNWNYEDRRRRSIWSIDGADQFFAVSPSKAKRIGVPPLLRNASATLCLWDFVHSQAFVGSIVHSQAFVGSAIVKKLLWDRSMCNKIIFNSIPRTDSTEALKGAVRSTKMYQTVGQLYVSISRHLPDLSISYCKKATQRVIC